MNTVNETHNPALKSWIESANLPDCDFPIQNLPFAEFRRRGSREAFRGGVAIGNQILDLAAIGSRGVLTGLAAEAAAAAAEPTLNRFMAMGPTAWSDLRLVLSRLLRDHSEYQTDYQAEVQDCLVPQSEAEFDLPCAIGDYTDFYTSIHHATRVGKQFRPDNPLLPNYKWIPIGYHGRSSSIEISGQCFHRPIGQLKPAELDAPALGPCKRLDYELELGILIGAGNLPGAPIAVDQAEAHVFGLCLLNDWSARDIQAWEYQPLGPFLSKSFASTLSPWVVTLEALAPFRKPFTRPANDPQPLTYLSSTQNSNSGSVDIALQVLIQTEKMREQRQPPQSLSCSNFRDSYWTIAQLVAHHTINGCNLRPGDLLGSGTQSGPAQEESGSMLELSQGGKQPVTLNNGEQRAFIEDGDSIVLRAHCQAAGAVRIGFGEVVSTVLPAMDQ